MDIERLIGVKVSSIEGIEIGEIVAIEIYGPTIYLVLGSDFEFVNGPDDDGGISAEPKEPEDSVEHSPQTSEKDPVVVAFRKRG